MEENKEFAQFLNEIYYLPNLDEIEPNLIKIEELLEEVDDNE